MFPADASMLKLHFVGVHQSWIYLLEQYSRGNWYQETGRIRTVNPREKCSVLLGTSSAGPARFSLCALDLPVSLCAFDIRVSVCALHCLFGSTIPRCAKKLEQRGAAEVDTRGGSRDFVFICCILYLGATAVKSSSPAFACMISTE